MSEERGQRTLFLGLGHVGGNETYCVVLPEMTYPKPSSLSMRHPSMSLLLILACDGLVDKRLMMHEVLYRVSTMHSSERGF